MKNIENQYYNKLYLMRDTEGEPNKEQLDIIRDIETQLKKYDFFVGISPFGSTTKGYNNETSDLDIYIIIKDQEDGMDEFNKHISKIEKKAKNDSPYLHIFVDQIDMEFVKDNLHTPYYADGVGRTGIHMIADLCRITTGKKIDELRLDVIKLIEEYPPEEKDRLKERLATYLTKEDMSSVEKIKNRNTGNFDEKKYIDSRKEMWLQRVEKTLGI